MNRESAGFTLLEVMLVAAIIGMVFVISVPAYERYVERARVIQAIDAVGEMSKTIKRYEMSKGALPDSLTDVGFDTRPDPWGQPYEYHNLHNAKGNGQARKDKKLAPLNSDFDLYSVGRDGVTAASLGNSKSRDDVVRARDGGFIGTAEEFDP